MPEFFCAERDISFKKWERLFKWRKETGLIGLHIAGEPILEARYDLRGKNLIGLIDYVFPLYPATNHGWLKVLPALTDECHNPASVPPDSWKPAR